jgi:hypothetical protein
MNRISGFRHFVVACAALFAAPGAGATMLQIEIDNVTSPGPQNEWLLPDPMPTNISVSFWIDTLSGIASQFDPLGSCLGHFSGSGLSISNFSVTADSVNLWSASSVVGGMKGVNASGKCPGMFFSSVSASNGSRSFDAAWDFRGIEMTDLLASPDHFANLLASISHVSGTLSLAGEWGRIAPTTSSIRIREVPVPATGALMLIGVAALWVGAKRRSVRSSRRATAAV